MKVQVRAARTAFEIVSANLSDLITLPDAEAAVALNDRIMAWNVVDELHERSYVERGLIAVQFEKKKLWQFLTDPDTNTPFASFTAWMSCSQFLGCRRTNFEAKADVKALADVPEEELRMISKDNVKVLKQLSTSVRNEPAMLQAAKTLPQNEFLAKIETEHKAQHLEVRRMLRFSPGRSGAKIVEETIAWAIEHEIAGSREEALVRMAETALKDWQLDAELEALAEQEKPA